MPEAKVFPLVENFPSNLATLNTHSDLGARQQNQIAYNLNGS